MDTRFQPEGLSFDNKNTFNPNFDNHNTDNVGSLGQYPLQHSQQQIQYSSQSDQDQRQYSPQPQQASQYGLPSGPRMVTPQQQGPYGLPSGTRVSTPQQGQYMPQSDQQLNNYSRLSNHQQQRPQGQQQMVQQQQSPPQWNRVPSSSDRQQDQYPLQSELTSRSNTWVQTPAPPFNSDGGYFPGTVDANGYPADMKDTQPVRASPFRDPPVPLPPAIAIPQETDDLEKHKSDDTHSGWDKHTKIPGKKDPNQPFLPFSQRLKHFTWANYTLTMATGGIATLIAIQPHAFPGLITIGAVFYITNIIFFMAITSTMILRFTKFAGSFKGSITHEREGLFLGPFFLSIATIITGTQKYIVEAYEVNHPNRNWAITTMAVAFWMYTFAAFCLAVFQYSFLFCFHTYKLTSFMPSWLLPIFPVMLSGTIASVIGESQPVSARMPILVAGLGCQGLGFTIAILMYAHYIGRLMQVGYPDREHRGAMFIGVGPPSFTCLALIGMANALPDDLDLQMDGLIDAKVLRTMALVAALFLWVLAMWFFMITLVAVSSHHHTQPQLICLQSCRSLTRGRYTSIWVGGLWFSPTLVSSLLLSLLATLSKMTRSSTLGTVSRLLSSQCGSTCFSTM
jgi:tellurite resistance protein TehA-like permease